MYLLRLPNSVYYTRIWPLLPLRSSGYPKEFKFSLLTRVRKVAYLRNIEQVQLLYALFDKAKAMILSFAEFKAELADGINQLRRGGIGKEVLDQFIESKQLENVTQLTIKQLQQFLNYLSNLMGEKSASTTTTT